jgi:HEPN domain-containing protein
MIGHQSAEYRLRLAQGFLNEARQDADLGRWRSTMDNAQLAVENAAKSALALLGPVGRTHNPAVPLRQALSDGLFSTPHREQIQRLAEHAEMLGPDVHVQTDYGDETGGRTPWELFTEADARQALTIAEESVHIAEMVIHELTR